jgi:hypothetical protein
MSTTPNYNWPLIENTDFVTNLPADLETLADAIDASFAADEGDLLVGGTSNIFEPLPIGAAGTVLTSDGDTAAWAAPSAGGKTFSLLNSGNTDIGVGTSFTVSGISNQDELLIIFDNISTNSASNSVLRVRFNGDTGTNYSSGGINNNGESPYSTNILGGAAWATSTNLTLANMAGIANSVMNGGLRLSGCNSSGIKPFHSAVGANAATSSNQNQRALHGFYSGTSTISSVTILTNVGNFDQGNLFIYGAA